MHSPYIEIEDVTKRYPGAKEFALQGVNLHVDKGEFFGLLGPNGSGKTTLISIICGLQQASSGSVKIAKKKIPYEIEAIKAIIGYVPQEIALYQKLSLVENLKFFAKLYGIHGKELQLRIDRCIEIAGLEKNAHKAIHQYSGGMKRRANLATALLHNPDLIIMDEPTANVDPQSRHAIFEIVRKLNQEGTTLIYTTHYLEEAENLCTYVAIIEQGKIICADTPKNLIANTPDTHDLAEVFLKLTGKHLRDELIC